jgi:hypothetical protein
MDSQQLCEFRKQILSISNEMERSRLYSYKIRGKIKIKIK